MALFEVRGLHKAFGSNRILRGIDLDVEQGEFVTILGESGCGKSILLKMMVGLLEADAGTVRFDGQLLTGGDDSGWRAARRRTGMLFQESALFDSFNVFENVAYALREQTDMTEQQIAERVADTLSVVALPGIEQMWPADLSGGMRKRVALARAIAVRPEVGLFDEPTEGLDPINVTRVNRLLLGLRERLNITTVVVTHNLRSAFETSDRLAMIHEGKIVQTGTPDAFRRSRHPAVREFITERLAQTEAMLAR